MKHSFSNNETFIHSKITPKTSYMCYYTCIIIKTYLTHKLIFIRLLLQVKTQIKKPQNKTRSFFFLDKKTSF